MRPANLKLLLLIYWKFPDGVHADGLVGFVGMGTKRVVLDRLLRLKEQHLADINDGCWRLTKTGLRWGDAADDARLLLEQ